jgi:cyclophilin family peptidyl-prolyl cis-trans isomerase
MKSADSLNVALYARVLRSADQRVLDSALIADALGSRDPEMRRVAARTLSQVALRHRDAAIPQLRALVRDRDAVVASAAIFGLGLVRDTASVPLLAAIYRTSATTAVPAAWSLGEIGAPAADTVAALLASSSRTEPRSGATRELIVASSKIRSLRFTVIAPYLSSADAQLRWAVAYTVARKHSSAGVRALLDVRSPDAAFRAELARSLPRAMVGDSLHDLAIARLRLLASDTDPHVRVNAIHSLSTFGVMAQAYILAALRDRDANVRVTAAQSAALPFDTVMASWTQAWSGDTSYKIRKSLLASAASVHVLLPGDSLWRASSDWRLRTAAVGAWTGAADTARARTYALAAARDEDGRVREAAYGVLFASDTARADSVVQQALLAAASDPDTTARNSIPHGPDASTPDTIAVDRPLEWYENAVRRVVIPSLRSHPPRATMSTARGAIVITFDGVLAPLTVLNYATLADKHYFDNFRFHRVVPAFVAQDGDPRGDGDGGPGYAIRDELTLLPYDRGAVGMALSGPDTGGSQYFLTLAPQPHLTGHYTVFGHVTSGLRAMDSLVEGDAINSVRISW